MTEGEHGGGEGKEVTEQIFLGLVGHGVDFVFYSQWGGSHAEF